MSFTQPSMPHLKRAMIFIDGQNLTKRFQSMKGKSKINPRPSVQHQENNFVWQPSHIEFHQIAHSSVEILQANYYTVSKDSGFDSLFEKIKSALIEPPSSSLCLSPKIIRFNGKVKDPKGDDIKLCIDALNHAYQNNADIFYLFTGDGDFAPLAEELKRLGKYVFVAALSDGLSSNLKREADFFWNLDERYFIKSNS